MDLGRNLLWRKNEEIVSREILRLVLLFNVKYALNLFQFIFLSLALFLFFLFNFCFISLKGLGKVLLYSFSTITLPKKNPFVTFDKTGACVVVVSVFTLHRTAMGSNLTMVPLKQRE